MLCCVVHCSAVQCNAGQHSAVESQCRVSLSEVKLESILSSSMHWVRTYGVADYMDTITMTNIFDNRNVVLALVRVTLWELIQYQTDTDHWTLYGNFVSL